jgi:hypothetical protein
MDWKQLLTPTAISVVVTSVLAPLIFYILKRRDERQKHNFEVRYSEYKKYLGTLDEIARSSGADFERDFMQTATGSMNRILLGNPDADHALVELNTSLSQMGCKVRESFSKATNELHGLRLVCSDALLAQIDRFVQLQSELMDESLNVFEKLKHLNSPDPNAILTDQMKSKGKESQELFAAIVKQMRKELGISGS